MELNFLDFFDPIIVLSGFALGFFIGLVADMINKVYQGFSRWVMSW